MSDQALLIHTKSGYPPALTELLKERGFQVEEVSHRGEARKRVKDTEYGVIFCDVSSSADDEIEFVKELCEGSVVPCPVFVTGPEEVPLAVKMMHAGARHYWSNPLRVEEVERLFTDGTFSSYRLRVAHPREETLLQIIKEITLTMELDGLVNILMDSAMELAGADGGALLLVDEKSHQLFVKAIRGLSGKEMESEYFGLLERRFNEILSNKQPVLLQHMNPPVFTSKNQRIEAMIATPIHWKEEPVGVLVVVRFQGVAPFSNDDFHLISLLCHEIAGAVHNAVMHQRTKELTIKDDLTEAYNRRYFDQYLEEEFERARRYGSNLSLIFFDVDNLKDVNVKYGHLIGSKTLQEIAHRIILTVRGIDKVIRYGGDEFCIVLPETDTQGAYQVADRIRNTISGHAFQITETIQVLLTGSMGIASFPVHAPNKEDLIRLADRAMFTIKNKTKNAIGVAESHPS